MSYGDLCRIQRPERRQERGEGVLGDLRPFMQQQCPGFICREAELLHGLWFLQNGLRRRVENGSINLGQSFHVSKHARQESKQFLFPYPLFSHTVIHALNHAGTLGCYFLFKARSMDALSSLILMGFGKKSWTSDRIASMAASRLAKAVIIITFVSG